MPTFPIPGYSGPIELHWGSNAGGSDIFAPKGTPVVAPVGGVVEDAGNSTLGGNNLTLRSKDGIRVYMAHLDTLLVRAGQYVTEGTRLGTVGDTGNAKGTGAHLHIGVGPSIVNGGGAAGGTGAGFDAVSWLRNLQAGTLPKPPAVALPQLPDVPSGVADAVTNATKIEIPSITDLVSAIAAIPSTLAQIPNATINPVVQRVNTAFSTIAWLGQLNLWLRIGLILGGFVILLIGLVLFALSFTNENQVKGLVKVAKAIP